MILILPPSLAYINLWLDDFVGESFFLNRTKRSTIENLQSKWKGKRRNKKTR